MRFRDRKINLFFPLSSATRIACSFAGFLALVFSSVGHAQVPQARVPLQGPHGPPVIIPSPLSGAESAQAAMRVLRLAQIPAIGPGIELTVLKPMIPGVAVLILMNANTSVSLTDPASYSFQFSAEHNAAGETLPMFEIDMHPDPKPYLLDCSITNAETVGFKSYSYDIWINSNHLLQGDVSATSFGHLLVGIPNVVDKAPAPSAQLQITIGGIGTSAAKVAFHACKLTPVG
jgi:hypothetical protein